MLLEDQYIVSGKGSMARNMTHPSLLDDNHLQYHLHLTSDLLPAMEELLLPGPVQQEIHIQVKSIIFLLNVMHVILFMRVLCRSIEDMAKNMGRKRTPT